MKCSMTHFTSIVLTVFLGVSSPVYASSIDTLFNTGVDSAGAVLPDGTIGDPHYSLISVPGGSLTDTRIITSDGGFPIVPIGPYIGDNTSSRWIGPNNDEDLNGPSGTYTYRTTFDLTGFDSKTASITGGWTTDNNGLDILINGISLVVFTTAPTSFESGFSAFSITSGFLPGTNTLDFVVNNVDGPTALRVEVTGTASPVPVPAAVWLFGSGLLVLLRITKGNFSA
jgi:hypothetical protein